MFFIGFEMGGYQLVLRNISNDFSITATGAGLLAAVQSAGFVFAPLLFGGLSDRVGKKHTLIAFMLTFMSGCVLCAVSNSMWVFVAGISLIGIGFCMCECIATAALAELYPDKSAKYINLTQALLSFGAVTSPVLIQWCIKMLSWNWRSVFFICGIGVAFLFIPFCLTKFSNTKEARDNKRINMFSFLKSSIYVLLLLSAMLYVGLENGIGYFVESLFTLSLSSENLGAYAISAYWLFMSISRFLCSFSPFSSKKTVFAGFLASFVLFCVLAVSGAPYLSLAICALIGFAFGPIWSLLVDIAAKEFPQHTGSVIGLVSSGCGLGGIIFTSLMGLLSDNFGIRTAFFLLPVIAIAACMLSYTAFKKIRNKAKG